MTANPNPTTNPPFGYNPQAGRYIDPETGRFISRESVFDMVDSTIEAFKLDAQDFITGVVQQDYPLEVFERAMMREIKQGHLMNYAAGRGGWAQMTQADYGRVGAFIKTEYQFLHGFMQDIATKNLTEAQIRARADLYFNRMTRSFHGGQLAGAKAAGKTEKRRILGATDRHCGECVTYAGRGWVAIDDNTLPLPTEQCTCKANCLCSEEYR